MPFNSISAGVPGPPGPAGPGTFTEETSIISVRDYGAIGDGVTGDRNAIYNAIAAANNCELLFPAGTYRVESDVIFSSTVAVRFLNGAKLSIDSGVTVTINGPLEAGLYQIFSGDGSANMGKGSVPMVYPQWWGAVGDDSTDNSSAFNKALEAVKNNGTLCIPAGTYVLNSPLSNFQYNYISYETTGIVIRGAGMGKTILKYLGSSDYAVKLDVEDELYAKSVCYVTLTDLHIQAPNISSSGGGVLFAGASHCSLKRVAFTNINGSYGTAIHARRRNVTQTEDSYTNDINRDFTTSGTGTAAKYAIKFAALVTAQIKEVAVRLARNGLPTGSITAYIYDDSLGEPGSQLGGGSVPVDCNTLSADTAGGEVTFGFNKYKDMPPVSASENYWLVFTTSGYVYSDGLTEVMLLVDSGDGQPGAFAVYNAEGSTWSTSEDGVNTKILYRYGQALLNRLDAVYVYGPTRAKLGLKMEGNSQFLISESNFVCEKGIEADGGNLIFCKGTQFSCSQRTINITGGESSWLHVYLEGGGAGYPAHFDGGSGHTFTNSHLAVYVTWDKGTQLTFENCLGPLYYTDDATIQHDRYFYKTYDAESPYIHWDGGANIADDPDALNGKCIQLTSKYSNFSIGWQYTQQDQYTYLPRGTYMIAVYAKDTNQLENDLMLYVEGHLDTRFTCTNDYSVYRAFLHIDSSDVGNYCGFFVQRMATGTNTISVSHIVLQYLGTDIVFQHDSISYNSRESDGDGMRKSKHLFIGRGSDGEQCVLAGITASHHGNSSDEKGKLELAVNRGSDGFSPNALITLDSNGKVDILGRLLTSKIICFSDGDDTPSVSEGNIFKTANTSNTNITMFDDGAAGQKITIIMGDNNTTIDFTGTNLKGNNATDWTPTLNDHMICVFDGINWYCITSDNAL